MNEQEKIEQARDNLFLAKDECTKAIKSVYPLGCKVVFTNQNVTFRGSVIGYGGSLDNVFYIQIRNDKSGAERQCNVLSSMLKKEET